MDAQIIKVSQLNRYVKAQLDENRLLSDLMVKGELTSVSFRTQSGHFYFTIADEESTLRCVMFSRYASRLAAFPQEGALVIVRGAVTLYERDGQFQLMSYDIQEIGSGSGVQDLSLLRKKLAEEGLFRPERKRPMPYLPRAVGIITSGEGAAVQDIITGMQRHNSLIPLILYPATVQGSQAVQSMLFALQCAIRQNRCDVIILGRGGGASESLAVFNDEELLRAVAESSIPVISAVGHDVDFTLMDEIADARAATPTAACQLCCVSAERLSSAIAQKREAIRKMTEDRISTTENRLLQEIRLLRAKSPQNSLNRNRQQLLYLVKLMQEAMNHRLWQKQQKFLRLTGELKLLNPRAPLERGYTMTFADTENTVLRSCREASAGQHIRTDFCDGTIISVVEKIIPNGGTDE